MEWTHLDREGRAQMVDVSAKEDTRREAVAAATVTMKRETVELILAGGTAKGEVLATARLAGIMAAKKTAELIPLCHHLNLSAVDLSFEFDREKSQLEIEARTAAFGPTGVEMEALTAVSAAALTVYDMCKAVDRGMTIGPIRLLYKSGGRSGTFRREEERREG